jgi:hypothetical protein
MNIFLGTFFHFIKFLKFKKSSSCLGRNLDFQAQPLKVIPLGRSLKFNKTLKGIPSIICKALGEKFVVTWRPKNKGLMNPTKGFLGFFFKNHHIL